MVGLVPRSISEAWRVETLGGGMESGTALGDHSEGVGSVRRTAGQGGLVSNGARRSGQRDGR